DSGRLAGAVRAEDTEDLSFLDTEIDVVDGDVFAERLAEVADVDCGHAGGPFLAGQSPRGRRVEDRGVSCQVAAMRRARSIVKRGRARRGHLEPQKSGQPPNRLNSDDDPNADQDVREVEFSEVIPLTNDETTDDNCGSDRDEPCRLQDPTVKKEPQPWWD